MAVDRDWVRIVADQRCPECGLAAAEVARPALASAIEAVAGQSMARLCDRDPARLRGHDGSGRWSALEYGAHVRDVLAVFTDRMAQAVVTDGPDFGWWDHEAAVVEEAYNDQDPRAVARELVAQARRMGELLRGLADRSWPRRGTRRAGEEFTVEGMARFALHEAGHHLHDADMSELGSN